MLKIRLHVFVIFILLAGIIVPFKGYAFFGIFGQHKVVDAVDGEVRIPVSDVNDGKAYHFSYKTTDKEIKFFVVKSRDGILRAAFDACDVCYPARKGYTQDGDYMICNNCGRRFHTSQVNIVEGGCNPAPLKRTTVGDNLVIKVADILAGGRFF